MSVPEPLRIVSYGGGVQSTALLVLAAQGRIDYMARNEPDLFERSAQLEDTLNTRRRMQGKDEVFLTRFGVPLREAIDQAQLSMFELDDSPDTDGECDSGWCMT